MTQAAFFILGLATIVIFAASRLGARSTGERRDRGDDDGGEVFAIVSGLVAGISGFAATPTEPLFIVVGAGLLVLALLSELLRRLAAAKARRLVGFCSACTYNLTGNVSGRCPECGKATESVDSLE